MPFVIKHWIKALPHFPLRVNLPLLSILWPEINSIRVCVSEIKLPFIRGADGLTEAKSGAEGDGWPEGGQTELWIMAVTQKHSATLSKHTEHPQHTDSCEQRWWVGKGPFFCERRSNNSSNVIKQNCTLTEGAFKWSRRTHTGFPWCRSPPGGEGAGDKSAAGVRGFTVDCKHTYTDQNEADEMTKW